MSYNNEDIALRVPEYTTSWQAAFCSGCTTVYAGGAGQVFNSGSSQFAPSNRDTASLDRAMWSTILSGCSTVYSGR